jgi:hypothetical protein
MAIDTNENYGHRNRHSQSESQIINSETMENKDPAINQHQDDQSNNVNHNYSNQGLNNKNSSEEEDHDENDTDDPFFQKNAEIAQDIDDDLENKSSKGQS